MAKKIYDDLSYVVNTEIQTEPDTYWRTLSEDTLEHPTAPFSPCAGRPGP